MDKLLKIFKALSDKNRVRIMSMLTKKELCVCEITHVLKLATSTVSKHLAVLKNVGLVEAEKRGLNVYYRLKCPCIMNIFSCIETVNKPKEE